MLFRRLSVARALLVFFALVLVLGFTGCSKKSSAQTSTVDLHLDVKPPFRFVAYGDTRFHNPHDTEPSNPGARVGLVEAIAQADPAFIGITGDIVYNGFDANDWKVWDSETSVWHDRKIPVYPALGNHDLHGDLSVALGNYFDRFPQLNKSRYYSVHAGNILLVALDSALDEIGGPQGEWLADKLDHVPSDVDFVFLMLHHPPYTSSSDAHLGGGHSARSSEQALARMLEHRQPNARYRIVVFAGHVHNYERHEHGGVTYFVSGGGGARPYLIDRKADDLFQGGGVNYHYLLVAVDQKQVTVTMNRLDVSSGKPVWTQPDAVKIEAPVSASAARTH